MVAKEIGESDSPSFFFFHSAGRHIQYLTTNILSHLPLSFPPPPPLANRTNSSHTCCSSSSSAAMAVPFFLPSSSSSLSLYKNDKSETSSSSPLSPSNSRLQGGGGLRSSAEGGGPAFVGQVFSMLDPSGNGLMAVTSHFDVPFLSKRTPEWIKNMISAVTRSEQKGPVFRFFMDLNDAVAYVKRLNIPTGMVGGCRLDIAYEHFKEKPHMFEFIPNGKQIKAANKLLKEIPRKGGRRRIDGVPVFTARNLNIAIATNHGIKWSLHSASERHNSKLLSEVKTAIISRELWLSDNGFY